MQKERDRPFRDNSKLDTFSSLYELAFRNGCAIVKPPVNPEWLVELKEQGVPEAVELWREIDARAQYYARGHYMAQRSLR